MNTPMRLQSGAIDALANYWFKRIELADAGDTTLPELNLEMGADIALMYCLKRHGVTNGESHIDGTFEEGFNMGLRVAVILTEQAFDAERALRELLEALILAIQERRERDP